MNTTATVLCPIDFSDAGRGALRYARAIVEHFVGRLPRGADIALEVAVGKPAEEILRTAREERCDLIVMSTHGLTGARKFFFGSTTERVLRETTVPVPATPATGAGPDDLEQARLIVGRILVPVDLTTASSRQVLIAAGLR